jgi:replicative DNA helicase
VKAQFLSAADAIAVWRDDVLSGTPPTLYPAGTGELARLEIGPGLVTLLGGAPGAGKTALSMQLVVDALRSTPTLRAVVCNIEMPPAVLLDRQLARLTGIDLTTIRHRRLTEDHAGRLEQGFATLETACERLCFVRPPFDLANVAASADAFDADLLLLDYIQRIPPPGEHGDRRGSVDATMDSLRQFADTGVAVFVVSAVGRGKDNKGRSSYAGDALGLASFRESSELEYGADDAFLLVADPDDPEAVTLRHLKSRYGEATDMELRFDLKRQRFEAPPVARHHSNGEVRKALADLWDATDPAGEDDA